LEEFKESRVRIDGERESSQNSKSSISDGQENSERLKRIRKKIKPGYKLTKE